MRTVTLLNLRPLYYIRFAEVFEFVWYQNILLIPPNAYRNSMLWNGKCVKTDFSRMPKKKTVACTKVRRFFTCAIHLELNFWRITWEWQPIMFPDTCKGDKVRRYGVMSTGVCIMFLRKYFNSYDGWVHHKNSGNVKVLAIWSRFCGNNPMAFEFGGWLLSMYFGIVVLLLRRNCNFFNTLIKKKISIITGPRCPGGSRNLRFPDYVTMA